MQKYWREIIYYYIIQLLILKRNYLLLHNTTSNAELSEQRIVYAINRCSYNVYEICENKFCKKYFAIFRIVFAFFVLNSFSAKKTWNFVEKFAKYERKFSFFNCYLLLKSMCIQSIKDVLKISRGVSQCKKGVNDYFYLDWAIFVLCKWRGAGECIPPYAISLRVKKKNCDKCL